MARLVDGEWRSGSYDATDDRGAFRREESTFRDWIGGSSVPDHVDAEPDERFHPEPGRYHLYVSYACPWAHRILLARSLLGLDDAISVSVVDPWRGADGWQFSPDKPGCTPDRIMDSDFLREVYVAADSDATCRVTVPVLWDSRTDTIVNNESREILRMLSTAFDDMGTGARLVPTDPESIERVDAVISDIYEPINNGVYRAGFATSQAAYDEAIDDLFDALDRWNDHLAEHRYLVADRFTEADICLFTTLVRFDHVYHTHFMCNKRLIQQYEHLWPYLRDVYQTPGVAKTVNLEHIREHYYTTHPDVTPSGIVARGPDLDWMAPHGRESVPGSPPDVGGA